MIYSVNNSQNIGDVKFLFSSKTQGHIVLIMGFKPNYTLLQDQV